MKFTTIAFAAVVGLSTMVAAASNTITEAPVNTATAAGFDAGYSSTLACITNCGAGNVICEAQCQGLPTPDGAALNATHDCIAACPPGGSAAANAAWAQCQAACVSSFYYTSVTYSSYVIPTAAGFSSSPASNVAVASSGASAAATGSGAKTTGGASKTTGSTPTQSPNAGAYLSASLPVMGALGLFLAAFAL